MADNFVGRFIAFKGENQLGNEAEVLVEVTEVEKGDVEIAFNAQIKGMGLPRFYLSIPLAELVRRSMKDDDK